MDNAISQNRKALSGLVQDYSISIALAIELLQSCTKPSHFQLGY